jgi:Asp-tRNA(Asn)/Glu-tRNA(Gln) amidotransferase A subunit family amidase
VTRVAFSADLGVPPVEAEVAALCGAAAAWWGQQGAEVVQAAPDLSDMQEVFLVSAWLPACCVTDTAAASTRYHFSR